MTDCNGFYNASCDALPTTRWVQRTTWSYGDWDLSYLWRHIGAMDAQADEAASLLHDFR